MFHLHHMTLIRPNSDPASFGPSLVRLHHLLVWIPQSTVHSFPCFITVLNGVSFLLDFNIPRIKAMPTLYNEIEREKGISQNPFRENIAFIVENDWVRAECLKQDWTFPHHCPCLARTSVLIHAQLRGGQTLFRMPKTQKSTIPK